MKLAHFPEANSEADTPYPAYQGLIEKGPLDGAQILVTAWKPSPEELAELNRGGLVFVTLFKPDEYADLKLQAHHYVGTDFTGNSTVTQDR